MTEESTSFIRAEPEINTTDDLVDALIEAVVLPLDAQARSAAIRSLIEEITSGLEWLHGQDTSGDDATAAELVSLRLVTTAAQDHERRMLALAASMDSGVREAAGRGARAAGLLFRTDVSPC